MGLGEIAEIMSETAPAESKFEKGWSCLMEMIRVLSTVSLSNNFGYTQYFMGFGFSDEYLRLERENPDKHADTISSLKGKGTSREVDYQLGSAGLNEVENGFWDLKEDLSKFDDTHIEYLYVGIWDGLGDNIVATYQMGSGECHAICNTKEAHKLFTKTPIDVVKSILSRAEQEALTKYSDVEYTGEFTDYEILEYRDLEIVFPETSIADFKYMIAPEFLRDAGEEDVLMNKIRRCNFQFAVPEVPRDYLYKSEMPVYEEVIHSLQSALENEELQPSCAMESVTKYLHETWLDEETCLTASSIGKLLSNDLIEESVKKELRVKIISERLNSLKEYCSRYSFSKENAIIGLATRLSNFFQFEHPVELSRLGVRKFFDKFMEEKGVDYTYNLLINAFHDDWWEINKELDVVTEWVPADESEGRPSRSEIYNSSFWEYYYYKVTVTFEGVEWSDILRGQHHVNGGWN